MGREIVYCSQCGARILERDLESGRAFTLLDKVFCAACREQAFSQAAVEEVRPPARAAAGKPGPASAARMPAVSRPAGTPGGSPPAAHRPVLRRKNNTPLYVGSAVGVLALVVLIILVMTSGNKGAGGGSTGETATGGGGTAPVAGLSREEQAARKLASLEQFAVVNTDPAAVVKKAQEIESAVSGTPSEEGYRIFRKRWERKIADAAADKEIDKILAQVKGIKDSDPEFKRYAEAMDLLQKAKENAVEHVSVKAAEVANLKAALEEPYETKASEWYDQWGPKIRLLMSEGEYKGAIKVVDKFPEPLRLSKIWRTTLLRHREDSEKAQAAKAAGQDATKDWKYYLRIGNEELGRKDYAKAKEHLAKSESSMPAADKWTSDEKRSIAWNLYYNFGCLYSEESKKLEGEEKKKSVDEAFRYLTKAAETDVFTYSCGHRDHPKAQDHWDKDEDLDPIRSDPRYAELIKKYAK